MDYVDSFLNKFTMYRVVLYSLLLLSAAAFLFSIFGLLSFVPTDMALSFVLILGSCYVSNKIFAKIVGAATNTESFFITSLILFLILIPMSVVSYFWVYILAGLIAMGSKYVLAIHKKHIFNPAAVALVSIGLLGLPQAEWWVASSVMQPLILITGFLIVRKLKRFHLFFAFLAASLVTIVLSSILKGVDVSTVLPQVATSWPLLFLGTVMLTEPSTTPPTSNLQMIYGAFVGFLVGAQLHFGNFFILAETSILLGNILSYIISPKQKLFLKLGQEIKESSTGIHSFIFKRPPNFSFNAGQYMEWTFPHKSPDSRGNRRYFTIASSPTEDTIRLGIRFYDKGSSFKRNLQDSKSGIPVVAAQLTGDFTLPKDKSKKLVFIAGGIGITPFRSMIKYLVDKNEMRDVVLIYVNKTQEDIVYKDVFDAAAKSFNLKTTHVLTDGKSIPTSWKGRVGHLTADIMKQEVPDFADRMFYISGSHVMVESYKDVLKQLKVPTKQIITDYFPGY